MVERIGINCLDTQKSANIETNIDATIDEDTIGEVHKINESKDRPIISIRLPFGESKEAQGKYNLETKRMKLLKGSDVKTISRSQIQSVLELRKKYASYIENGKLTRDTEEMSASEAARIVLITSCNGRIYWVDNNGRTIEEIDILVGKGTYDRDKCSNQDEYVKAYSLCEINEDTEEGSTEMTPEEMLVKGLIEVLKGSRNSPIEIGDKTITKINELLHNNEIEEEYTWKVTEDRSNEQFNDCIFGYNLEECTIKLELKKALLLMGVPGVGKTKILKQLLNHVTNGDTHKYKLISFSQNTDYTDFIGGLICINGSWAYKDGELTKICKIADSNRHTKYYLGIDEMSRGNTEAIFGELMTGLEHRDTLINLKNGRPLVIPSNLYIIGTMNISDNSTKKLDIATLERFIRYDIKPQWGNGYVEWLCRKVTNPEVKNTLLKISTAMVGINKVITKDTLLGIDKVIGTRAISGIELTLDNIKIAINSQLLPEINERTKNCEDRDDELLNHIDAIKGAVGNGTED